MLEEKPATNYTNGHGQVKSREENKPRIARMGTNRSKAERKNQPRIARMNTNESKKDLRLKKKNIRVNSCNSWLKVEENDQWNSWNQWLIGRGLSEMDITTFEDVENKIVTINHSQVLIDRDVAELYGVETRDINKAVKNNPDKFPDGYVFELSKEEFADLRGKFSTAKFSKTRTLPKAFTEKGLYMLATILKSKQATQTTIAIVETFTKIRHLSRSVKELSVAQDKDDQKALMQKSGELIAEILDDDLAVTDSETSIELNFAVLKFRHTVKKKK